MHMYLWSIRTQSIKRKVKNLQEQKYILGEANEVVLYTNNNTDIDTNSFTHQFKDYYGT